MKYDAKKLKALYDELRNGDELVFMFEDAPGEGYVEGIEALAEHHNKDADVLLKSCEVDQGEKDEVEKPVAKARDVGDETKKMCTFVYFDAFVVTSKKVLRKDDISGKMKVKSLPGFLLFTKNGYLYEDDLVNELVDLKENWETGDIRRCCACYDDRGLIGVSICHVKDEYSKKEARYNAYNWR